VILASLIAVLFQAQPLITESRLASLAPWLVGNTPLAAGVLFLGVLPMLCSTTIFALAAVIFMAHEEKPLTQESPQPASEAMEAPGEALQGLMALSNAIGSTTVKPALKPELAGSPLQVRSGALAQEDLHQIQQNR
jgi:hypothetical protein